MTRIKQVCTTCGSDDVIIDAWAKWDVETQQAELHNVFDNRFCNNCESECKIKEIEI